MPSPMAGSAHECPGAAAPGTQAPLSPETTLQVFCSGLVSRQRAKCHKILRKEPGVSSRQPGDHFPVRLTTSFPIPAPFFPLGEWRAASGTPPLCSGRCWGAAGAAAISLPGLLDPPSPLRCPLQGQSPCSGAAHPTSGKRRRYITGEVAFLTGSPPPRGARDAARDHRWGLRKSLSAFLVPETNYKRALKLSLAAAVFPAFLCLPLAVGWVNCSDSGAIV